MFLIFAILLSISNLVYADLTPTNLYNQHLGLCQHAALEQAAKDVEGLSAFAKSRLNISLNSAHRFLALDIFEIANFKSCVRAGFRGDSKLTNRPVIIDVESFWQPDALKLADLIMMYLGKPYDISILPAQELEESELARGAAKMRNRLNQGRNLIIDQFAEFYSFNKSGERSLLGPVLNGLNKPSFILVLNSDVTLTLEPADEHFHEGRSATGERMAASCVELLEDIKN